MRKTNNSNPTFTEIKKALTKQYEANIKHLEAENGEASRIELLQDRIKLLNEISDIKITPHKILNTRKNLTPVSERHEENPELKSLPRIRLINSKGEEFTINNLRGDTALAFARVNKDIISYLDEVKNNPSLEEIKSVLTKRYEEEIRQVEAENGKRKNSTIAKIQRKIDFLNKKISDIEIVKNSQADNVERYSQISQIYNNETEEWNNLIDKFIAKKLSKSKDGNLFHVMQTPIVCKLAGMDILPIKIRLDNINKILHKKTQYKARNTEANTYCTS